MPIWYKSYKQSSKSFREIPKGITSIFAIKKYIMEHEKLGKGLDFDLVLTSSYGEGWKRYLDDNEQVSQGHYLDYRMIPAFEPGRGTAYQYLS